MQSTSPAGDEHTRHQQVLARLLNLRDEDSTSLVNQIILSLAQDIIEGVIAPGETVNSIELAKRFATSRTPIREALIALEREGLIEIPPRRRPRVVAPSPTQVSEIYELRASLHAMVARKVARQADERDLAALRTILDEMRTAAGTDDVDGYFWSNVEFHFECLRIAGDATLRKTLDGLGLQVLRLRRLGMSIPGRVRRSIADHERILTAYEEHDEDVAAVLSSSVILAALTALRRSSHISRPTD